MVKSVRRDGRGAWRGHLLLLTVISASVLGCTREREPLPGVSRGQLVVGPPAPSVGPGEAESAEILEQEGYVLPRAYPEDELSPEERYSAFDEAAAIGEAYGNLSFDPASDTCGGQCTDDQACVSAVCCEKCASATVECPEGTKSKTGPAGCFCVPEGGGTGAPPQPASGCGWLPIGPTNIPGRVDDLAFDPANSNRLIAATAGGLYTSPDKGREWRRVVLTGRDTNGVLTTSRVTAVESLAFNNMTGELFVATGDGSRETTGDGIWLSKVPAGSGLASGDSGTWSKVTGTQLDGARIFRLRAQSGTNGSVYAATDRGLYLGTRSSGNDWTWDRLGGMDGDVDDVLVDFAQSPPVVFAGVKVAGPAGSPINSYGVWRYVSAWTKTPLTPPLAPERIKLALGRATGATTLYARVNMDTEGRIGLWKSPDDGGTWTPLSLALDPRWVVGDSKNVNGVDAVSLTLIEVAPNDPNRVYLGGRDLYLSSTPGTLAPWQVLDVGPRPGGPGIHGDVHAVAFDPSNRRVLYAGTDGGVFRSTDTSKTDWTWMERSYGLQNSQFYKIAQQQGVNATLAAGMQDNGFAQSFGNRTWYNFNQCDGLEAALGAGPPTVLYSGCQSAMLAYLNLVPYSVGGGARLWFDSVGDPAKMIPPSITITPPTVDFATPTWFLASRVTTDPTVPGVALARGIEKVPEGGTPHREFILKSDNVVAWTAQSPVLPQDARITAMAISPSAGAAKYYYVAVQPTSGTARIYVSANAGATWSATPEDAGVSWVNKIAVDPTDPTLAWLASRDGAVRQRVPGGPWQNLAVPDPSPGMPARKLPTASAVTGLVVIPPSFMGTRMLVAATDIGVYMGYMFAAGQVYWDRFDFGLPAGVDVQDIQADIVGRSLVLGTWGHGAFRYAFPPVGSEGACPGVQLVVRDNVFDHGQEPSPNGVPDPEWPALVSKDPNHATEFPNRPDDIPVYKPDDSQAGRMYFWESTDIRVEVPFGATGHDATAKNCPDDPAGSCPLNSVEFDSCPTQVGSCPDWMLHDMEPTYGDPTKDEATKFYVQVANNGLGTAHKVRVISLIASAASGVPTLPGSFTDQFPAGGGCPTTIVDPGNGWREVGCQVIEQVGPFHPEIASFKYVVEPKNLTRHSCMVAIVDSMEDPAPLVHATMNVELLAQNSRHVAQRNLIIADGPGVRRGTDPGAVSASPAEGIPFSGLDTLIVPNRWATTGTHQVLFGKAGLSPTGRLAFLLPAGKTAPNLPPSCGAPTNSSAAVAISLPKGLVGDRLALAAGGSIDLGDRAVVRNGAPVSNTGSGKLTIGAHATTGTIWSTGDVFLRSSSTVTGDVNLGGQLTQQDNITITGDVHDNAGLEPADAFSWSVAWPTTSRGSRDVQPGQTDVEAPGRLGAVSVKANGTLKLSAGVYYVDSLMFDSQSKLLLDQTAGPTTIYTRGGITFRGTERTSTSAQPDVLVVAIGTIANFVETSFTGTVVAPSATLTLGGNGGTFVGSFYAKDIVVRADVNIEQRTSTIWTNLPACRALTPAEQATATAAGLSPVLYPVVGTALKQQLPIPYGQSWTIGLRYDSGIQRKGTAGRFRVMSLDPGSNVMAGNTFLLRQ